MEEKLIQFSRGNFKASRAGLRLSDASLIFQVEEGKEVKGSFYIGSETGAPMQGVLYSECPYITLERNSVDAKELSIEYTFTAKELRAGETVNSCIRIITNCGEAELPVIVSVDTPAVNYKNGRVSDLAGFAAIAEKAGMEEALQIFKSDEFAPIFLYRDIENNLLYNTLKRGSMSTKAMEEFLVATRKKNRVIITVDRNNLTYEDCYAPFTDKIKLTRSTWGSDEIVIRSTASFIKPAHKRLWTDGFIDDSCVLEFAIETDKMHAGENKGSIILETMHQIIEINISCTLKKEPDNERNGHFRFVGEMMRNFVNLRNGIITPVDFRKKVDELTVRYRGIDDRFSDLCQAYAAIICSSEDIDEYMVSLEPCELENENDVANLIQYCLYQYVFAMYYTVKNNRDKAEKHIAILHDIYENKSDNWFVFSALIKADSSFKNGRRRAYLVTDYIKNGYTSPMIFADFCDIVREDCSILHKWDDSMIRPIAWGARRGMISEEATAIYGYYVSRLKNPNGNVLTSLECLYEQYGSAELLQIICRMLIKLGKNNKSALYWYEKGIEKQLRITGLYENYMRALDDKEIRIIPHAVLMYFMYDNRLSDKEKSKLFAAVIRGKNIDTSAYKAYSVMISNYARKQLEAGNIDINLAVIYEDCIRTENIDESIADALPKVMFRNMVICNNPMASAVCVVHKEVDDEQIVPLVNGVAYVDVYSRDAYIFIVDKQGNRHYGMEDYTIRRLLNSELYAELCFVHNQNDNGLLLHMFIKSYRDYKSSEDNIFVRRLAHRRLNLNEYYKKNNLSALIFYYYEHADGERLDEMLKSVDLTLADRNTRNKWIELFIVRGMFIRALKALKDYGYENVDMQRLGKLCEMLSVRREEDLVSEGESLSETLVTLEYEIFARGGYTKNIIAHLVKKYRGSSDNMIAVRNVAKGLSINCLSIEERLLKRIMHVEDDAYKGIDILCSYLEAGNDEKLKKAYVSYLCYEYIRDSKAYENEVEIPEPVWQYIRNNVMAEYNKACLLALLKFYSNKTQLSEDEKTFCEIKFTEMYKNGILMDFFPETDGRIILQCNHRTGIDMKLKCVIAENETQIIKVPEVYDGIYATEIVVFAEEKIAYEFYEEKGNAKVSCGTGTVTFDAQKCNNPGRIGLVNLMIQELNNEKYDELCDKMEEYIEMDETSKDLFVIL